MKTLSDLKIGEKAIVKEFASEDVPVKLLEMGCLPGNELKLCFVAPLNDPLYVEVSGYSLAIRKEIAEFIVLEDK